MNIPFLFFVNWILNIQSMDFYACFLCLFPSKFLLFICNSCINQFMLMIVSFLFFFLNQMISYLKTLKGLLISKVLSFKLVFSPTVIWLKRLIFYRTMEEEKDVYTEDGTVDIHKNPANKKKTGNWKACRFILGNNPILCFALYCNRKLISVCNLV